MIKILRFLQYVLAEGVYFPFTICKTFVEHSFPLNTEKEMLKLMYT